MTEFKKGVSWDRMAGPMWMAREVARALHVERTGKDMVITSGRRKASPGGSSLHPHGKAFDIRVWYFANAQAQQQYAAELQTRLGPDFDVIVEGDAATDPRYRNRPPHIHIEYDPRNVDSRAVD